MKLIQAIARGIPLVVDTVAGGLRFAAEIFVLPGRVVYFDVGWDTSDGHPIHLLEGEATGEGPPWRVGDAEIRPLTETDPPCGDMLMWDAYLAGEGRERASRAAAEEALQRYLASITE